MDRFTVTTRVFHAPHNDRRLVAKEFVPRRVATSTVPQEGRAITLLFVHATGFHKELWEPTLEAMSLDSSEAASAAARATPAEKASGNGPTGQECVSYSNTNGHSSIMVKPTLASHLYPTGAWYVDRIVTFDCFNHGDSAVLNKDRLGNKLTWTSIAHDIIDITEQIRSNSTMVGVGHSFGASSLLIAQLLRPDIFDAIFAVEPVLAFAEGFHGHKYELTLRRRAVWNSKAHAIKYFTKHPFFATWDQRVLQIFLRHGLSPATAAAQITKAEGKGNDTVATATATAATTTTAVQLKCQPRDEYETYMGGWVDSVRTIDNMSEIICPTRFLLGELSSVCPNSKYAQSYASSCLLSDARVAKDLGHLIPMESPETVAYQLGLFLSDHLVLNTGLQFRSRL